MCGRFSNDLPPDLAAQIFRATNNIGEFKPRYNAAPTQELPVVRFDPDTKERTLDLLRWGLVPHWSKDLSIGNRLINARAERIVEKPSFRDAFAKRRCIVPAKGFYEWEKTPKGKQPYAIVPKETDGTFAFAGLWENWRDRSKEDSPWVRTFTIITGKPNTLMAPIHDRMPVILQEENWAKWLGEEPASSDELQRMIREPYPSQLMRAYPVSPRMNSTRNDDPGLLDPMDASGGIRV